MLFPQNPTLIDTTVLNLLSSKIPTLLSSLCQAFIRKPQNTHIYLKWLRSLLKYHVTILFNPSQQQVVKELRKVLEGRTRQIGELARLKGKMSVVLGRKEGEEEEGGRARPRVKYVEDVGN
jgi:O6-methylguanine-DNA--protein-cysteine methyltransferase